MLDALDAYDEECVRQAEGDSLAIADMMNEVDEALSKADAVRRLHAEIGATRQTDLAVRLPAVQLKVVAEILKLIHVGICTGRSGCSGEGTD